MQADAGLNAGVLTNMRDGVMTLNAKGTITLFNPAAERMLGVEAASALGHTFAEVFMLSMESNEEFEQAVVDALYEHAGSARAVVPFARPDGARLHLSLTTSFLDRPESEGGRALIVVFTDITDLKQMQEEQAQLNRKLGDAFRELEQTNQSLRESSRKVRVARLTGLGLLLVFLAGAAIWTWTTPGLFGRIGFAREQEPHVQGAATYMPARTGEVSMDLSLTGHLEPLEKVNITAPFAGCIVDRRFAYGQQVEKGEVLLELDPSEITLSLRSAESEYIQARQEHDRLREWESGSEMARAKRNFVRSKMRLDELARKLEESRLLVERGIESRQNLESVRSQCDNQQLDFEAAREELAATRDKGSADNVRVARMKMQNAQAKFDDIRRKLEGRLVRAPVAGVVLMPTEGPGEKGAGKGPIEIGARVEEGRILVAVGNLDGLSVRAKVDEVDIGKLRPGQNVLVMGDAFPGVELRGRITDISSQASSGASGYNNPTFDVRVGIDGLTPEQARVVRLGMSAVLLVRIYHREDALLVPISALSRGPDGDMVMVCGPDGEPTKRSVAAGMTTLREVEILDGLAPGEEVLLK